jgi:SpoIID/LytB domain protein
MSARCPEELLRAHAVISRSWLLAQLEGRTVGGGRPDAAPEERDGVLEIRRWYDREDHEHFHVCADDHCQRYQGVTRMASAGAAVGAAVAAVEATRGLVLVLGDRVCDARFSKCCGGMTERFSAAWGDLELPYLQAFPDCPAGEDPFRLPLTDEDNVEAFLRGAPLVWCNRADRALLERILPELDHGTERFFRWDVSLTTAAVRELLVGKLGLDPGPVQAIRPLERGASGRIVRLEVVGRDRCLHVGKELEIRRMLSPTHLYSSAFTVRREGETFHLHGGGWGHGVGLCQIGAAVMADHGCSYREILGHYYRGADLRQFYP